jgi:alkyl hydroperoxide reductase subunit AhpC
MVTIGERAPDFSCNAYTSSGIKKINFEDYLGKWRILLFYVADFSAVCPTELIAFNKDYDRFKGLGAEIFGISTDSVEEHGRLMLEDNGMGKLRFPLLSDPKGKVAASYGVFDARRNKTMRSTFIVNPDGILKYILITDNYVGRSTKETYRVLSALKSGKACMADWEPKY